MSDVEENNMQVAEDSDEDFAIDEEPKPKGKPGIIYLPTIPPSMTVTKLTEILSEFGEIGRVFLQPEEKSSKKKRHGQINYTEGWVEFKRKKIAKYVAAALNNNRVSSRKRSKYYDYMWSMKYLPRFKWVHLSERLAYERAVHRQRLLAEVMQAKREASHFMSNVERSEKINKFKKKQKLEQVLVQEGYKVPQRLTDDEHLAKKPKSKDKTTERKQFVENLFGSKK